MVDHAARLKSATHLLLQLAEEFAQTYATKRKFKVYISWHPSYRHKTAGSKVKITNMCGHSSMDLVTKQYEDVYNEAHMSLIGDGALRSVTNEVARLKSGPCYLPGQLLCSSHCVQHFSSVQHCPTLLRTYFYCQYISTPLLQYSMSSVKICSVFTPLTLSSNYIHFHFQCCNIELEKKAIYL